MYECIIIRDNCFAFNCYESDSWLYHHIPKCCEQQEFYMSIAISGMVFVTLFFIEFAYMNITFLPFSAYFAQQYRFKFN